MYDSSNIPDSKLKDFSSDLYSEELAHPIEKIPDENTLMIAVLEKQLEKIQERLDDYTKRNWNFLIQSEMKHKKSLQLMLSVIRGDTIEEMRSLVGNTPKCADDFAYKFSFDTLVTPLSMAIKLGRDASIISFITENVTYLYDFEIEAANSPETLSIIAKRLSADDVAARMNQFLEENNLPMAEALLQLAHDNQTIKSLMNAAIQTVEYSLRLGYPSVVRFLLLSKSHPYPAIEFPREQVVELAPMLLRRNQADILEILIQQFYDQQALVEDILAQDLPNFEEKTEDAPIAIGDDIFFESLHDVNHLHIEKDRSTLPSYFSINESGNKLPIPSPPSMKLAHIWLISAIHSGLDNRVSGLLNNRHAKAEFNVITHAFSRSDNFSQPGNYLALTINSTPLLEAINYNQLNIMLQLITHGAAIDKSLIRTQHPRWSNLMDVTWSLYPNEASVLWYSIPYAHEHNTIFLFMTLYNFARNMNLNAPAASHGQTLLMKAIHANQSEYSQYLLDQGADPNIGDFYGKCPLIMALDGINPLNNDSSSPELTILHQLLSHPEIALYPAIRYVALEYQWKPNNNTRLFSRGQTAVEQDASIMLITLLMEEYTTIRGEAPDYEALLEEARNDQITTRENNNATEDEQRKIERGLNQLIQYLESQVALRDQDEQKDAPEEVASLVTLG